MILYIDIKVKPLMKNLINVIAHLYLIDKIKHGEIKLGEAKNNQIRFKSN